MINVLSCREVADTGVDPVPIGKLICFRRLRSDPGATFGPVEKVEGGRAAAVMDVRH